MHRQANERVCLREAVDHRSGCARDLPRTRLALVGGDERAVLTESERHVGRDTRLCRNQAGSGLLSLRLAGPSETLFSARPCPRLPRAPASLGQSAGWAALASHTGLVFDRDARHARLAVAPLEGFAGEPEVEV
eukprot:scaffold60007_cov32-Phaeocystis_antarctica.AAC.1